MQSMIGPHQLISRAEARERGLPRFFHGRPCKHGHIAQRSIHTQGCCECLRLLQNTEAWKEKKRAKYAANEAIRHDRKSRNLKQNYGLTLDQYNDLCKQQNFLCAICGEPELRGLVVDHCHKSGRNRALLCVGCNLGLGALGDDPETCMKAAAYLRKHARA